MTLTDVSSYHILLFHSVSVGDHEESGLMQHCKSWSLFIVFEFPIVR